MKQAVYLFIFFMFLICGCTKEKELVYEVNKVNITSPGANKKNVKTTTEFISIAYSDLFGTPISNSTLVKLSTAYYAFGDKKLIENMVIKSFIKNPKVSIPTSSQMSSDLPKFVTDCYKKFYNRIPNEYEKWFEVNLIKSDSTLTPELIYFAFLTSTEYRYY